MTTATVLDILRHRFYVFLVAVGLTLAAAVTALTWPGVYSTRCDVVLVPPRVPKEIDDTTLVSPSESLIALAGLVERTITHGHDTTATSQEVDLLGTGVRDGVLISLPNSGGQWDYNFTAPMLSVQVAGPDPELVQRRREQAVARIQDAVRDIQTDSGVTAQARMVTTQVVPEAPPVVYRKGHGSRAAAGILLIGGWLSVLLTVATDRALVARSRTRARRAVEDLNDSGDVPADGPREPIGVA